MYEGCSQLRWNGDITNPIFDALHGKLLRLCRDENGEEKVMCSINVDVYTEQVTLIFKESVETVERKVYLINTEDDFVEFLRIFEESGVLPDVKFWKKEHEIHNKVRDEQRSTDV